MHHPQFNSPAAYCEHVRHYLENNWQPCQPTTVAELQAVLDEFPQQRHRFLPSPDVLRLFSLPPDYGMELEPLDDRYQEQFLHTLATDKVFARAVAALLREASAW